MTMAVLTAFGEVEWARLATGPSLDGRSVPPVAVFRFKDPATPRHPLADAVTTYRGEVSWAIEAAGKNIVIWPQRLADEFVSGRWRVDSELRDHLADADPEFSNLAMRDFVGLLKHIEDVVQEEPPGD
jgi:hypothetical protein